LAVSATRNVVMDQYQLGMDPCDYRLIRFSNCMQILACVCWIASMIEPGLRDLAQIIDNIAELVYHTISGCMTAQVAYEIDYQLKTNGVPQGVPMQNMKGPGPQQGYPPQQQGYPPQQQGYPPQQGYPQQQQYPQQNQYPPQQGYPPQQQYPQQEQYPQQQQYPPQQQGRPGYNY
jgi:hypothetical protein